MEQRTVFTEYFNSLPDFVHAVATRPLNPVAKKRFKKTPPASHRKKTQKKNFYACNDFEEACNLALNGDVNTWHKVVTVYEKICINDKLTTLDHRPRPELSTVGFLPCVPAYLAGRPRNMITLRKQKTDNSRILSLIINGGFDWRVKPQTIANICMKITSAVLCLEKNNYRVNLYLSFWTRKVYHNAKFEKEMNTLRSDYCPFIKLKDASQTVNGLMLSFPLINPDMLRRLSFAYTETLPTKVHDSLYDNYGCCTELNVDDLPARLKNENPQIINAYMMDENDNITLNIIERFTK